LYYNYKNAPNFDFVERIIEKLKTESSYNLAELNLMLIETICSALSIKTKIVRAKDMLVTGAKTDLLINILTSLGAEAYIVGKSGLDYMELEKFEKNKIKLITHHFTHPNYVPFNYDELSKYPSIIDVIANLGITNVKEYISKQV
jgi:hypothetical protein